MGVADELVVGRRLKLQAMIGILCHLLQADEATRKRKREGGPLGVKEWPGKQEEGLDDLLEEIGTNIGSENK